MSQLLHLWDGLTGVVLTFAGATPPKNWLLCDGQAISRTLHAKLFSVIGTMFGAGDGTSTFNLPDLRGRVAAGKDNMGGTPANRLTTAGSGVDGPTLGAAGGNQAHTLTTAQMPAHGHTATDSGHGHSVYDPTHAHTVYDPGHSHQIDGWNLSAFDPSGGGYSVGADAPNSGASGAGQVAKSTTTGIGIYAAATGISIYNGTANISIGSQGGGGAHNNTQPTIVLNHIIRT